MSSFSRKLPFVACFLKILALFFILSSGIDQRCAQIARLSGGLAFFGRAPCSLLTLRDVVGEFSGDDGHLVDMSDGLYAEFSDAYAFTGSSGSSGGNLDFRCVGLVSVIGLMVSSLFSVRPSCDISGKSVVAACCDGVLRP